ncbi:unnamed protein product [Dicrocoelium dendriticum]|nr:unnamed protein product [Dicrocoelium dendriticum]
MDNCISQSTFGPSTPSCNLSAVSLESPTKAELFLHTIHLKHFKAEGLDEGLPEMLKYGDMAVVTQLTSICLMIRQKKRYPPLEKINSKEQCIPVILVASNILRSSMLRKLAQTRRTNYAEEQACFGRDRVFVDQIHTIQLLKRRHFDFRTPRRRFPGPTYNPVDPPAL